MVPGNHFDRARELRPSWAEVSLDALGFNLGLLRSRLGEARVLGVVKADAYGHGAPQVALALEREGVDWLGVALVEEGAVLRQAGVTAPILVMGPASPGQLPLFARYRLTPAVSSLEQLETWSEWARGGSRPQAIHLEIDTGMTRLGIALEDLSAALEVVRGNPRLELSGLMSHLAESEALESPRNPEQTSRFLAAVALLDAGEGERVTLHLANSAGALHHPACRFHMVRCGLALYGADPARRERELRPVMAVKAEIVAQQGVASGTLVGYNGRWRAERPSRLGVLQVGYADGYPWRLVGSAGALAAGQRVPVVGAVSMDVLVVDLTDSSAVLGDVVVLLGAQGDAEISAWELAEGAGTIPYEVMTRFGQRLHRRYLRGGQVTALDARQGR